MADVLLSPAVGGTMWVAAVATRGYLGAFVFASQMINFTIPGTDLVDI